MSQDGSFQFRSASATHVGTVRRLNEDSYLDRADLGLWAVADGMGGHEAGDYASQTIIRTMHTLDPPENAGAFLSAIHDCLADANRALRETANARRAVIGSTIVVLLTFDGHFACLWAGDSRLYLLRDGMLTQLTRDHSQVQELVDAGVLSADEAEHHPDSSVITRAVGVTDQLQLDVLEGELAPGDLFLLCSDGLVKALSQREIVEIVQDTPPQSAASALIERALARHASDNVTAILVSVSPRTEQRRR